MSNEEIYTYFLKKMGVSEFMDVFPYVRNWEGWCKNKIKKIKYTCIE